MGGSKIIEVRSTKPHEYQDAKYGKFHRVCNLVKSGTPGVRHYRDTVTGNKVTESGNPVAGK